ncbi:hypothetical protein VNO77_42357 [Canavalia gladiata]|uniref:Uncharacterized protein n=1 Tax=Canavalia gladiata TaxID=3824 RepID=A0AAN9K2I6_CANGL
MPHSSTCNWLFEAGNSNLPFPITYALCRQVTFHPFGHQLTITLAEQMLLFQREEAKIIAWESLQKAKVEAAIRKLEVYSSSQYAY